LLSFSLLSLLLLGTAAPVSLGPPPRIPVQRVVTLAPSLTDVVLALESREQLVGVSRFDERPEVKTLPRVGGFVDPSVEAVLALRPGLVLVQPGPGNRSPVEKLASLGTPVLALPLHTVEDVFRAITETGRVLGKEPQARHQVQALQKAREAIRQRAAGLPRKQVLVVYGFTPLIVAGPGSFADELLSDVGAGNAASMARVPFASYSTEALLAQPPDLILDCSQDEKGAARFHALPGISRLPMRKTSRSLMQPGPALDPALKELFTLVHGDAR